MIGTKDILINGAKTDTPHLNDFAKLVADKLPETGQVDCQKLAFAIMDTAFEVKNDREAYHEAYPELCRFLKTGGDMMTLSAQITDIIAAQDEAYAKEYRPTSKIFFGE